jgi:hypothetical protein
MLPLNAISALAPAYSTPMKPTAAPSTGKRQRDAELDIFDDNDAENVDPVFTSPSKKSRTDADVFTKPAKHSFVASPPASAASVAASPATSLPSARKPLSSVSAPSTAKSTPISCSRGSPKNKRLHAISKRRASASSFRRVDPPSFSLSSPALPFSIDAALSGTLSTYTPTPKPTVAATPMAPPAPPSVSTLDESMPNSWFFEIHEDTPEEEAANLMEHSASVLDISSEDDAETKQRNEELQRGKENLPPSDFALTQSSTQQPTDSLHDTAPLQEPVKHPRMRALAQDDMDEDRKPLGDLCPSSFYGAGLDANSYVTVNAGIEKPSGLSKEIDINAPTPKKASKKRVDVPTIRVSKETEASKSWVADQPRAEAEAEPQTESQTHKEATRPRTRQSALSQHTEATPAPSKKR